MTVVAQKLISLMLMGFKDSVGCNSVMPYFYSFTMVKFTAVKSIVFKLLVGKWNSASSCNTKMSL
jgi:hypothetical protein